MSLKSDFLALLGLTTFTVAAPVLETLGHGSTFFVTHGAESPDILAFTLAIYLLPAMLLMTPVGCLQFFGIKVPRVFVSTIAGVLVGFWAMSFVTAWPAIYSIASALLFGALIGCCYATFPGLRELLRLVGLLSPLVVVFFLMFTPIKNLLFPGVVVEGGPIAGRETPVVVLLFDELSLAAITTPDGEIDAGRLPNFSRLERISTWYHDTTTVSTVTDKAVPAILSGMRTNEETQPIYSEFPLNLFSLTAASHNIYAMETYTRLCPSSICSKNKSVSRVQLNPISMYRDVSVIWLHSILPLDLAAQHLPSISNRWANFNRERDGVSGEGVPSPVRALMADLGKSQRRRFGKFISAIRSSVGPSVIYLHLAVPHIPWIYLPDGTAYNGQFAPGQSLPTYGWVESQYLVDQGVLRYSLQVEFVDHLLGQALDALEQSGRMNEVMLVVVSDHGVGFTPGEERRIPVAATLADVSRVPLFIKYPRQLSGVRDERKIETIDIFPTITNVLGLGPSENMDGQSLIAEEWQPVARHVLEAGDSFPDFESEMDLARASERIYRVLQSGKSALEAISPDFGSEYSGRSALATSGADARFVLYLDNSSWYTEVDLNSGFLPARLTGTLMGAKAGVKIMATLNGHVAGVGMTYDEIGHVSIMLDPRRFRAGKNEVRAYAIEASEILEINVARDFEGWAILRNDDGIVSVSDANGNVYQQGEALEGSAVFSSGRDGMASLKGYACDEILHSAPTAMLLTDGDEIITSSFTMTGQPLLAKVDEAIGLKCWFSLAVSPKLYESSAGLFILALFQDGRLLEIHPKGK